MKTIIMAGGKGTRISTYFPEIPKPLIPIAGIPVLEREISSLVRQGFTDIILTVSYLADQIQAYFGNGSSFGAHIQYYFEEQPLGNAGALFKLREQLTESFLLLNADAMFDVDFRRFVDFHKAHINREGTDALVTLFTHPNSHPYDSGVIVANPDRSVEAWLTKEDERPKFYKNRVNAGLHVMEPKLLALSEIDPDSVGKVVDGRRIKVDLDRQLLKPLAGTHQMFCYDSPEYVKDMGTPERYEQVLSDFALGVVREKNLSRLQKAIFLDRDGTINKYVGFLRKLEEFELIDGVAKAIRKINNSGYLCVVVSNQPVIARGEITIEELNEIHNKMETLLGEKGAYIDGLYYCPHHPHKGYEGEVAELKINCSCRKPKPGMLLKAAQDFHIDLSQSWTIGDSENDISAGKRAGTKTALIGSGEYEQDITVSSLLDFVERYLL